MLKRLDVRGVPPEELRSHLPQPSAGRDEPVEAVRAILAEVAARGDAALFDLTERFDGVRPPSLVVSGAALDAARRAVDPALLEALHTAAEQIRAYHRSTMTPPQHHESGGITVQSWRQAVRRAGCYVPGGRALYPSTVLMTAIPAQVAGVEEIVLCVPPGPDGAVPAVTLAAAAVAGVEAVHPVGGAQAIAALAFGTASIRAVDVIVGPGNAYVAVAKREVAGRGLVGVPSAFAGPSEVVVVADETVPPDLAAIDVIVQAEHGPDGLAWLLCWSDDVATAVTAAVQRLAEEAPRRAEIVSTLDANGYAVVCDGPEHAMAVANVIAPEHLELLCDAAVAHVGLVRNAGAIFCGAQAPASIGDYLAGPSHTLPTHGTARFSSVLSVDDFTKHMHTITVTPAGFDRVAPHVVALARAEGFQAHAQSILLRQEPR